MITRLKIIIRGVVQGVGFRPFIFRLASEMGITGFVSNSTSGVLVEAEGEKDILDKFSLRIKNEKPLHSSIHGMELCFLDAAGYSKFEIAPSSISAVSEIFILPDIAVCDDCLKELFDPGNRRYRYPFINCTNCGPRFSIIESFPYDRINTSMKFFEMCDDCRKEYEDTADRRFHAQPTACPVCGPEITLMTSSKEILSRNYSALSDTAGLIKSGKIVALKGLGGYQLIVDALNDDAVLLLRQRKNREEKPFAIMTRNLPMSSDLCEISDLEKNLLCSPESPVVLLKKKNGRDVSKYAAPGNPYLGIMHPYTPLHHLLLSETDSPVIATSGNLSEEPMCINEDEAFSRLNKIADFFLVHNRGIVRSVDDSVIRIVKGREMIIRRARGYAPLPLPVKKSVKSFIALGGHSKNTISIKKDDNIFVSQHIGDLENKETEDYLIRTIKDLSEIYEIDPGYIIHDLHPNYATTRIAGDFDKKKMAVQHHHAHAAACYYENQLSGSCLAVCWDGTGYGSDNTIWGGEFFIFDGYDFKHTARLKNFLIQGGGKGIRDIKRAAAGVLYDIFKENTFKKIKRFNFLRETENLKLIINILEKNINCFSTTSTGRLIDAVSFFLNLSSYSNFEGEAAMRLEFSADAGIKENYPFHINSEEILIIDWHPMIENILSDIKDGVTPGKISAKFHNTLVKIIVTAAMMINEKKVILTGGCFQNMYLLNSVIERLREINFTPYWHQRVPTNDGGISFGQAAYAAAILEEKGN